MKNLAFLLSLLLLGFFLACSPSTQEDSNDTNQSDDTSNTFDDAKIDASDRTIVLGERVGAIKSSSTPAELKEIFGAALSDNDTIYTVEGNYQIGNALYKGTPDEIQILWDESGTEKTNPYIFIRNQNSTWKLENGIGIGSTLGEVVKANNDNLKFRGFGWDFSGHIFDYGNGNFKDKGLHISLTPSEYEGISTDLLGDTEISSDAASVNADEIVIEELQVGL